MSDQRNVLTIATGKPLYFDMAVNLARSFVWWNRENGIKFYLVTDLDLSVPTDIAAYVIKKKIERDEFGEGFSIKLHLDQFAPEGKTLFIDSDCFIFGDLTGVFDAFKGHCVSVIGKYINDGEWFGDIKEICRQFKLDRMPQFNGGIYYLEKGTTATAVYQTARELERRYDEIGFVRLRHRPNDEVLMSLALELQGQTPIIDDGAFLSDPQACQGGYKIDVIKGSRLLINPPSPSPLHRNWHEHIELRPLIVHFLGYYTSHYPYKLEVFRLKKAIKGDLNWITELEGLFMIELPIRLKNALKNTLRPIYRAIFGIRKVKLSERL